MTCKAGLLKKSSLLIGNCKFAKHLHISSRHEYIVFFWLNSMMTDRPSQTGLVQHENLAVLLNSVCKVGLV